MLRTCFWLMCGVMIGALLVGNLSPLVSAEATRDGSIVGCGVGSSEDEDPPQQTRQAILWTSGDPDVAHRMVLMYCGASQKSGWFDNHQLIIWGPSARLLAGDKDLQQKIKQLLQQGVDVKACIVCANSYGVTADLKKLGIDVKPMGRPLAELQKSGWHLLTF